jgi:pimeloyl-ACP methyl ester carboxylesterase
VGAPQRVYLAGASLGGLIALKLAEEHPDQYAGCLAVAGPIGGTLSELDYIGTVRVLFDYFYPGVLPGSLYQVPPITDFNAQVEGPVVAAVTAHPERAMALALLMDGRLPFVNSQELVGSILNALSFQLLGANDFFDRTHGHPCFDNSKKEYSGSLPAEMLAAVNAGVARYTAAPSALNYYSHYYEPTGTLRIPMLTLHNSRDPFVPAFHETTYGSCVAQAGDTDKLVQRVRTSYGHTTFTPAEIAAAFHDLAGWVGTGVKP